MRTIMGSPVLGIALLGLFTDTADAQKKNGTVGHSSVKFVEDIKWRGVLLAGRGAIENDAWKDAIFALQSVLNEKNDYYVQLAERDSADPNKQFIRWVSVKFEANNLLGSMPAAGLQAYEEKHGAEAKALFDEAKKKKDGALLAEVAQRFRHTKAGSEAHAILVKQFTAGIAADAVIVKDWPSWRGNLTNTGQAAGTPPLLDKKLWSRLIMMDSEVWRGVKQQDQDQLAEARVKTAIKQVIDLKQPVLPGFFPIASQGVIVYRSQRDVRAVTLVETSIKDEENGEIVKFKPGELLWKSIPMNRSSAVLLQKPPAQEKIKPWLDAFEKVAGFNSFLYENTLLGTLAYDGQYVYAINDLGVPPHPAAFAEDRFNPQLTPLKLGDIKPLVMQNDLFAYDLVTGKLKWDLGSDDAQFKDSHFLSVPISVGGKLYVLNEKMIDPKEKLDLVMRTSNPIGGESELRLICLDPNKLVDFNSTKKPKIETILVLANVVQQGRMVQDIRRRVHAAQLAYRDGVLVCPTNAGEMFGIDLMTRRLAWSYSYREHPHLPIVLPGMAQPKGGGTTVLSKWKSAPPAVQAGKIVFTAADADSVHCINLKDGKPIWRHVQQKGDLYMAGVFDGRVLIVSDSALRALDLKDGKQLWTIATNDLPAGQGAATKGFYCLPLKKGEIVAVNIVKGQVKARHRAAKGEAAVGNLIFYDNLVLMQTPTEVIAYPQLGALLEKE